MCPSPESVCRESNIIGLRLIQRALTCHWQYQLAPGTSATLAYVGSQGRHLITAEGTNNVTELLPPDENPQQYVPYPEFARGSTYIATEGIQQLQFAPGKS